MKCTIPASNVKIFARAIHSLARIGDELYVEPHTDGVSFRTVNSSRSAFALFNFNSAFFSHYDSSGGLISSDDSVKCKVAMKACLNAFKSLANVERSIEKCKLVANPDEDKLTFILTCKHGINKTYNLSFMECETLEAVFDKDNCPFTIASHSKVLSDSFANFHSNQEEVTLIVSPQKTIIKSYVDDEPDPSKAMHTELTLEADEFEQYDVKSLCEITFCLKEVRALLYFSEPMTLPISATFSKAGSPLIFSVQNQPWFEAHFVLATLASQTCSQLSSNLSMTSVRRTQINNKKRSMSIQRPSEVLEEHVEDVSAAVQRSVSKRPSETITDVDKDLINGHNNSPKLKLKTPHCSPALPPLSKTMNKLDIQSGVDDVVQGGVDVVAQGDLEEVFPGTPPAKRRKFLFQRCFESTFYSGQIAGHDQVLAEDSDLEDS